MTSQPPFCKNRAGTVTPSILIEIEKFFFHQIVYQKVGRGIEFQPNRIITSLQDGCSKLTPAGTFWRETSRMVVAQNKLYFWNRLDVLIIVWKVGMLVGFRKKKNCTYSIILF